jgi:uncharacterized protein (TIGR00369 family)
MNNFQPRSADFTKKVKDSFARQTAMQTLGIKIDTLRPGEVILAMDYNKALTQQHGFIHAGIITTGLDSAAGYAAFSLMADDAAVLTVEFKVNLMAPARGDAFLFKGFVVKPGRNLTFTEAKAYAINGDQEKLIATMSATMMAVVGRGEIKG